MFKILPRSVKLNLSKFWKLYFLYSCKACLVLFDLDPGRVFKSTYYLVGKLQISPHHQYYWLIYDLKFKHARQNRVKT